MSVLDPRLRFLQQMIPSSYTEEAARPYFGVSEASGAGATPGPTVSVLVQVDAGVQLPANLGFHLRAAAGDVISGEIPISKLADLASAPGVVRAEAARQLRPELDRSLPEIRSTPLHAASPATKGAGVIVGIIDTGIDYQHACFRKSDNSSRILSIWDQWLSPTGSESSPAPYGYGVEYTKAQIDAALGTANPLAAVRHRDGDTDAGHGTHVAGIAAGNGRASAPGQSAGTYVGVAPEADIIVVANRGGGNLGNSARTLEAIQYIFDKATALRRPCVINLSQGDNVGPHDGTSLLERGIDNLLGTSGRAMVKSAGNAGDDNIHASGQLAAGAVTSVQFTIQPSDPTPETIDIWYAGPDRVNFSVTPPGGSASATVGPNAVQSINLPNGNRLDIDHRLNDPFNHDNRIFVQLSRGTASTIAAGQWTLNLSGATVSDGRFHAWIDRGSRIARFSGTHANADCTISIPGTSREVISVGSYVTRNVPSTGPTGQLSTFSSLGPTRDGRIKPEIAAPGEMIWSARASGITMGAGAYHDLPGTSMAAPHVAGACALIFERHPQLTAQQVKAGLTQTARTDTHTGTEPNKRFGYGKLDVQAAVNRTYPPPLDDAWVRMQSSLANWPASTSPPTFDIFASTNGDAVIELAWDPAALLAPSMGYTGAQALRYYTTAVDFQKAITKADGSSLNVQVPRQQITLANNRASWTMPTALWNGYVEEVLKAIASPPRSAFGCNLYYRVRMQPPGASAALVWPADAAILNNPSAPRLGLLRVNASPPDRAVPDPDGVAQMGGLPGIPNLFSLLVNWLWRDLPETDPVRRSLEAVFGHSVYRTELTNAADRGKLLKLWLFAGPTGRGRITQLLGRRVWGTGNATLPAVLNQDLRGGATLVDNLLSLLSIAPHPDLVAITSIEQIVDDVIAEICDPNGQMNQGGATSAGAALQTLLVDAHPSEYARLQRGLLSTAAQVDLANGNTVQLPPGIFQVARYAGAQSDPFRVRTSSELAFQAMVAKHGLGTSFPAYDPTASPTAANGINTVFQATLGAALNTAQIKRTLEALLNRSFNISSTTPSSALRDSLLSTMQTTPRPMVGALVWRAPTGAADSTGRAVVFQRFDAGRLFFKNTEYPGSSPPAQVQAGASGNNPPRRFEDPPSTLESIGDSDLASWLFWFYPPAP